MQKLDSLLRDARYALSAFRRAPLFAAVAMLSIGGGIAAGAAIFTFAYAVMYRPLAVGDGKNLYEIHTSGRSGGLYSSSSYVDFLDFRAGVDALESACATTRVRANFAVGGNATLQRGELVNPECFDALQIAPRAGRVFNGSNAGGGAVPVVIGSTLWQTAFGGRLDAIGRVAELNGLPVEVIGVAPVGFAGTSFDEGATFWVPIEAASVLLPAGTIEERRNRMFSIYARLRDGASREQAEAGLAVVAGRLRAADSVAWADALGRARRVSIQREVDARFAGAPGSPLLILGAAAAAVAIVIAIACLNLATMLLARGASRQRELAIRLAIGASRGRLIQQLSVESLMIALGGSVIGLGLTWTGARLFAANRPQEIPAFDIVFDWRIALFGVALASLASLLFGLAPALHAVRLAVADGLRGRAAAVRVKRVRAGALEALIVAQVAVSVALFVVASLFAGAMSRGNSTAPGFTTDGVAIVEAHFEAIAADEVVGVVDRLLDAASRRDDLANVSAATVIPLMGSSSEIGVHNADSAWHAFGNAVAPRYFAAMSIPIVLGRDFELRDGPNAARVAIVNEMMARAVWGTTAVVGQSLMVDSAHTEIIGVVADTKYRALSEPVRPLLFLPMRQRSPWRMVVHTQYRGGAETLAALERTLRETDGRVVLDRAKPMNEHLQLALLGERMTQLIGSAAGTVQLALALMALWGLVAYAVARRANELGVRLALGATPQSIVWLVLRPAAILVLFGTVIGTVGGTAIAKVVQASSWGLAPLQLGIVVPVALLFSAVALFAGWMPARRAALADPVESIRRE